MHNASIAAILDYCSWFVIKQQRHYIILYRLYLGRICLCSVSWLIWLGSQYQNKWLTGKRHLRN